MLKSHFSDSGGGGGGGQQRRRFPSPSSYCNICGGPVYKMIGDRPLPSNTCYFFGNHARDSHIPLKDRIEYIFSNAQHPLDTSYRLEEALSTATLFEIESARQQLRHLPPEHSKTLQAEFKKQLSYLMYKLLRDRQFPYIRLQALRAIEAIDPSHIKAFCDPTLSIDDRRSFLVDGRKKEESVIWMMYYLLCNPYLLTQTQLNLQEARRTSAPLQGFSRKIKQVIYRPGGHLSKSKENYWSRTKFFGP
jgi:hypothetical protein